MLLLAWSAAPVPAGQASGPGPVTVQAFIGFSDSSGARVLKLGYWAPLRVRIGFSPGNPGRVIDAVCRLRWRVSVASPWGRRRSVVYEHPVRLATGTRILSMDFPADESLVVAWPQQVRVELVESAGGRVLASCRPGLRANLKPWSDSRFVILEIGDRDPWLPVWLAGCRRRWREDVSAVMPAVDGDAPPRLVWTRAADAPGTEAGYHAVDAVFWRNPVASALLPGQVQALRTWVSSGGRLVLACTSAARARALDLPDDLLPARVRGVLGLRGAGGGPGIRLPAWVREACAGTWENAARAAGADPYLLAPAPAAAGPAAVELEPRPGARVLLPLTQPGPIVMLRRPLGRGSVIMLAPLLGNWPWRSFGGTQALLGRALGVAFDARDLRAALDRGKASRRPAFGDGPLGTDRAGIIMRAHLADSPPLRPLPFWLLAAFLACYVLVVGPLDYLLLSRVRRLRLTWFTMGIGVLVFCVAAWLGVRVFKGSRAFARELVVRDLLAGSGRELRHVFCGIYAVADQEPDLVFGAGARCLAMGGGTLARVDLDGAPGEENEDDAEASGVAAAGGARAVVLAPALRLRQVSMAQWSLHEFYCRRRKRWREPPVRGNLRLREGGLAGAFTTRIPLDHCLLVSRAGVFRLGTLPAGGTWRAAGHRPDARLVTFLARSKNDWDLWLFGRRYPRRMATLDYRGNFELRSRRGLVRMLAIVSLQRMLGAWDQGLRTRIRESQRRSLVSPARPGATGDGPLIGLSVEQVWNARTRPDQRWLRDLSGLVWRGGVLLLAAAPVLPPQVRAPGVLLERKAVGLVRVVFPPAARTHAGGVWRDDFY